MKKYFWLSLGTFWALVAAAKFYNGQNSDHAAVMCLLSGILAELRGSNDRHA